MPAKMEVNIVCCACLQITLVYNAMKKRNLILIDNVFLFNIVQLYTDNQPVNIAIINFLTLQPVIVLTVIKSKTAVSFFVKSTVI